MIVKQRSPRLPLLTTIGLVISVSCVTEVVDGDPDDSGTALVDAAADAGVAHDVGVDAGGVVDAGEGADAVVDSGAGQDSGANDGASADAGTEPGEARGVWVTRWNYSSQADVETIVQQVAENGFNQIYFQIRGSADAYYQSSLEPWAAGLSGTLGQDPGWDPLQVAIDAAHGAGLELHAWLNTFAAWSCSLELPQSSGVPHVLEAHPEWAAVDSGGASMLDGCTESYIFLSPGLPEVQAHIQAVTAEIAAYAVDGIHLDYIRYPGRDYSHDTVSEARYVEAQANDSSLTWEDWQRQQINATVQGVFEGVTAVRPATVLSAAVWFVYENSWGWSSVSQGNVDYYQDPRAWSAAGSIDVVVPMLYFPLTDPPGGRLDFRTLLQDHIAGNAGRHVYAGLEVDFASFDETAAQIAVTRELGAPGFVAFAYTHLESNGYWDEFAAGPNADPASPPVLPWR